MTRKNRLPLAALLVASLAMISTAYGKKAPVEDLPPQNFRLPAHFEKSVSTAETIMLPIGSSGLVTIKTTFKNAGIVHDLRPLEGVININEAPEGVQFRQLPQSSKLAKVGDYVQATNVVRVDLNNAAIGQSFTIEGTAELRNAFSTEHVLDTAHIGQSIVVIAYDPDIDMVKQDRYAALYYVRQSLANYEQLTKKQKEMPWEIADIETLLAQKDEFEGSGIAQLLLTRLRSEEARRHLNAATNSSNQDVATAAKQALQDVDTAFEAWKKDGVGKQKKEKHVDQMWAEDKLDRRYASINLPEEEHFSSNINLPTVTRPWLTPISMGLQLESRFGALGAANRRSTALTETLSGQLAIHDYFWIAVRLPMYSMRSQADGAKWTTGLLNPGVTIGTGYVQREHWRVRLEVEFMPNIGLSEDMEIFEYFATEMPGSATAAHVLSINPSVELARSQFTFSLLTGVQLALGDTVDAWFRYAVVGGVWLHKRFALQLDDRGRVQMNGDNHLSYGAFGFSAFINLHENWNMELGMITPHGDNVNLTSMQFYITFGCGRWGTLSGKMKAKKNK